MLINLLWKLMWALTALSLIVYAVTPNATLGYLVKLFALNWGIALMVFLGWPHVRGVRKGDIVYVSEENAFENTFPIVFTLPRAIAKNSGRLNGFIQVEFGDGTAGIGKIIKYQGLITHAEVRFIEKDIPVEIMKQV